MTRIDDYLAELENLLADVDPTVREGLVGGIREELAGLSDADAVQRLRALGDPAFVAASARAELPRPQAERRDDPAWYSVATVLMLTIGGFAIPVIGWLVGIVMLWASKTWTGAQKVTGTFLPVVAAAVPAAFVLPAYTVNASVSYGEGGQFIESASGGPAPWQVGLAVMLMVVAVVAWFVGWIWLLVVADRARRS